MLCKFSYFVNIKEKMYSTEIKQLTLIKFYDSTNKWSREINVDMYTLFRFIFLFHSFWIVLLWCGFITLCSDSSLADTIRKQVWYVGYSASDSAKDIE